MKRMRLKFIMRLARFLSVPIDVHSSYFIGKKLVRS